MYGIYLSASGAQAFNNAMEVLSNNIANADTAGFKREFPIMRARPAEAIAQGRDTPGSRSLNDIGGGVRMEETITRFAPGVLKQTGVKTDLAIVDQKGDTFFKVEKDGEQLLTRAGNFEIDREGYLTTQEGHRVLAANDQPLQVNPMFPIHVDEYGNIHQRETGINLPLALARPRSFGDLAKAGSTLFRPLAETQEVPANERRVRQGVLEHSGASPIEEMMELIKISRGYEANVRMIQTQDDTTGALLNRVLGAS